MGGNYGIAARQLRRDAKATTTARTARQVSITDTVVDAEFEVLVQLDDPGIVEGQNLRILAAEEVCNIDWMFWRFARPDVCKPYVVSTVGPGTYDPSRVLVPFDDIHFADHSPGNNQGDEMSLAELLGWASVKHASVADVVRGLAKRQPSGAAWTKIQEFCELGIDGIYATEEPFHVYRQRDRWYIGAGCKRAIALCWLGESSLDLQRIGVRP